MQLDYDVVYKSLFDLMFEFEDKTGVPWYRIHNSSEGHCRTGKYWKSREEHVGIGVLGLDDLFPKLSVGEKLERYKYRSMHDDILDVNTYGGDNNGSTKRVVPDEFNRIYESSA